MSEKIQPIHTERDAYVYIRQSSMQQVRTHLEGQRRHYDLRDSHIRRPAAATEFYFPARSAGEERDGTTV
ncbi:MAG: hypothetical protein WA869_10110 [Alloacidobacterium sp.]|jgi:hypothetical protein